MGVDMVTHNQVWRDQLVFRIYDLLKNGHSFNDIAKAVGVSLMTLKRWRKSKPMLKLAIAEARRVSRQAKGTKYHIATFQDYIYQQLPAKYKEVWDKIHRFEKAKSGADRINALLARHGMHVRQALFLHAWITGNFSITKALKKVCISRNTFENWKLDPNFLELVNEVQWHKKNFFEEQLVNLVKSGDGPATIFANKTLNRDRGYGEKIDVVHSGTIAHAVLDIDTLDLPLPVRRAVLQAIELREALSIDDVKYVESEEVTS
jgi:transposase